MEVDGHEIEQEQYLNGKALYDVTSGGPRKHGHLAIANGAVKSSDEKGSRKGKKCAPIKFNDYAKHVSRNETTMSCKWKTRTRKS
jgi:ribosome-associated protein YbcJ (S4-like RNA binding protein)